MSVKKKGGERRREDEQVEIERDSPVGLRGVSSHTSVFLSVGYSSSRSMKACSSRQSAFSSLEKKGKQRRTTFSAPLVSLYTSNVARHP